MPPIPNAAFSTKFTLKPCRAGPHHWFSPARVCSDDHFVCLALGLPHPTRFPTFFNPNFIKFINISILHTHAPDLATHHIHHHPVGRFSIIWPSAITCLPGFHQQIPFFHQSQTTF